MPAGNHRSWRIFLQPITVSIADRDPSGRVACKRLLRHIPGIRVVAGVAAWQDVVPMTLEIKPRILLCSFDLAADAGYSLLLTLRRECPETLVILLTDHQVQEDQLMPALFNGALGFVARASLQSQLPSAVRGVAGGEAWVPRRMLGTILARHIC